MKFRTSAICIALLCGSLLLSLSSTSAQKNKSKSAQKPKSTPTPRATPSPTPTPNLQGTYTLIDPAAATVTVKKAIEAAVKDVSVLFRGSVRGRLKATNLPPPQQIVISFTSAKVIIKTDQSGKIQTDVNGTPVPWTRDDGEKFQVSTKWVNGNLERTFKGGGGERVNTYSIDADGTTLTLSVALTSSWLGHPCAYELIYKAAASTDTFPESPQMAYYYYKVEEGRWSWRLKAADGRVLAGSGEDCKNEQDCLRHIDLVKQSSNAPVRKE